MKILYFLFIFTGAALNARHFIIDICSYNNSPWCVENLLSVWEQTHTDYHIILTIDASSDDTLEKVQALIKLHGKENSITIKVNKERMLALYNHWQVILEARDDDIICHLDGDDRFADKYVLEFVNKLYEEEDIWLTYGQHVWENARTVGYPNQYIDDTVVRDKLYRDIRWTPGQLRTFEAWLAKRLRVEDLLITDEDRRGLFFPTNCDIALFLPMMEMAGIHFKFIQKILYIYNDGTSYNDVCVNNRDLYYFGSFIRKKSKYPTLLYKKGQPYA